MALGGAGGAFKHFGYLGCGGHIGNASGLSISGCRSALSGRKAERGTRTTAFWFGNQTRHTVCPHKVCSSMTLQALL